MYSAAFDIGGTQLRAAVFDEERKLVDVFKTNNDRVLASGEKGHSGSGKKGQSLVG